MNYPMQFVAAAAAVIAIALVDVRPPRRSRQSCRRWPSPESDGDPVAQPSPTASASECGYGELAGLPGCAGAGGRGASIDQLRPAVTFRTPDGWENNVDIPASVRASARGPGDHHWSEVVAAYQGENCSAVQKVNSAVQCRTG